MHNSVFYIILHVISNSFVLSWIPGYSVMLIRTASFFFEPRVNPISITKITEIQRRLYVLLLILINVIYCILLTVASLMNSRKI